MRIRRGRGPLFGLIAGLTLFLSAPVDAAQKSGAPALPTNAFPLKFGGPFSLVDHEGKARKNTDFPGKFLLVYFGYTYCPDICPTGLQTISTALDELGGDTARIQPLFISVDPKRDRPEILKGYVEHFHPKIVGLTGSEAQVRAAAKAYRVHRTKVLLPDTPKEDYLVNHTSITYLMSPDGEFRTMFPHGTKPEFMAKTLRKYLAQPPSG